MRDFLVEIHTEELPPKALKQLATCFLQEILMRITKAELAYSSPQFYATPRRLAVFIKKLASKQKDFIVERKGPALSVAFDHNGQPTPACMGFANSCGVPFSDLERIKTAEGERLSFTQKIAGKTIQEIMPTIIQQALAALPIPKRMRWGMGTAEFVRPIHSIILLYGNDIIPANIVGLTADRKTRGHRFLSKGWISIARPAHYLEKLKNHFVIADYQQRKETIRNQSEENVKQTLGTNSRVLIDEELLDEVTSIVEWPVAFCGSFSNDFLVVPQEALISAMQDHQRYFPIVDQQNKLLPFFVTISNIPSTDVTHIINGNERVLRARLADAKFFFETDLKQSLALRLPSLKHIVFQDKLGTMYQKAERLSKMTATIAKQLHADLENAKHAGLLAKTDLTTQLVSEFPELQGIAGFYYALHDGLPKEVAIAISEQYLPRFSGDTLPTTQLGCALAIADRLDALIGVFGVQQSPTSDKDPYGLRRAALGVLRILIENQLNLDLHSLLQQTADTYTGYFQQNKEVVQQVLTFMLERLKHWYHEKNISADVFVAVTALHKTNPYDIDCRIQAVHAFKKQPEAAALSVANKRVSHILTKYEEKMSAQDINPALFVEDAEKNLAQHIFIQQNTIISLLQTRKYTEILKNLASLREPVDVFFDKVLVMTEDKAQRENRLLLLKKLRELFLYVADIALLQ